MNIHPLAGRPAPAELLVDVSKLEQNYYGETPDLSDPNQRVSFGTSGHRGTPLNRTFTEAHILAIAQAICDYRRIQGINGPLFLGKDTHAVSAWAERSTLEVMAANGLEILLQTNEGFTPTPVISRAILIYNRGRRSGFADGVVLTPSHNPPEDGGIKYNPPNGGPAETEVTGWIQTRANELLQANNEQVKRLSYDLALKAATTHPHDFIQPYLEDLASVIDMEVIRAAGISLGVDPLGGASLYCWEPMRERYGLRLTVVNPKLDPTFRFMTVDLDGKIRMDCSSPYAMASLVRLKDQFDIAFGSDPDADRHGIVTRSGGLMNPNHFLAAAIRYLVQHRPGWSKTAAVGKTVVSSNIIDRVVQALGRKLVEVPVGFKWFADGLFNGSLCFGGEESAGASFLRQDGIVWTTDKDGLIMGLLAAELLARTGKDPWEHYSEISQEFGQRYYTRIDVSADLATRQQLKKVALDMVSDTKLVGEPILVKLTHSPENNQPIGGIKIVAQSGWLAARPSGTEDKVKLYAESTRSEEHLAQIVEEGNRIIQNLAKRPCG